MTASSKSVAIVLGSGGVLGSSFHAGVLLALIETWGIDAREVDELLGTSAGAVTASFVAAGLSPADLIRREQGRELSPAGRRIMARRARPVGNRPDSPQVSVFGRPPAPGLLWSAIRQPGAIMPGSILAGLAPRGRNRTDRVSATINDVLRGVWPTSPNLRIATVKLSTGHRRIFSGDDQIEPGHAVAASCSVPAIHRPVKIEGGDYVDGACHSANNVDAVGAHDIVIVSSPMTSSAGPEQVEQWMVTRQAARLQLHHEIRSIGPDTRVVVIEPDKSVIEAMGSDIMRPQHRATVALAAHRAATVQLEAELPFVNAEQMNDKQTRTNRGASS